MFRRALLTAQLKSFSLPFFIAHAKLWARENFFTSKYFFTQFLCATRLSVLNPFRREKKVSRIKSEEIFFRKLRTFNLFHRRWVIELTQIELWKDRIMIYYDIESIFTLFDFPKMKNFSFQTCISDSNTCFGIIVMRFSWRKFSLYDKNVRRMWGTSQLNYVDDWMQTAAL